MSDGASFEATAGEIHALLQASGMPARLIGSPEVSVRSVSPLESAAADDLSFVRSDRFLEEWASSHAGVTLVTESLLQSECGKALEQATDRAVIAVPDADFALIALLGYVKGAMPSGDPARGVHESASVDPSASVHETASIGPHVSIGAHARIGADAVIRAHATVGDGASIGERTRVGERVCLGDRCSIGDDGILHPGVVIGADGFGFRQPAPEFGTGPFPVKVPHIGHVEIGHHVEIGANSCVDRATYGVTRIRDGVKIDNLCQIGHNCDIGPGSIICGCCAMGGSTTLGAGVLIGGHVGVADNITLGAGCRISAASGVVGSVPAGEVWGGSPARPLRRHLRKQASLEWLADSIGPLREMLRSGGRDA